MSQEADEKRWAQWMTEALNGEQASYRSLLQEIYPALVGFFTKRVGSPLLAEDLTQESLMAIHKNRVTWEPGRSFQAWMFAIARYKLIDFYRAQERRPEIPQPDPHQNHQISMESQESLQEFVQDCLSQLPEEMARALQLTQIEGYSTAEAAEREKISPGAMRMRISRAYKKLREIMENES